MTIHEHYEYNDATVALLRCRRGLAMLGAYRDTVYPTLNLPISAIVAELLADVAAVADGFGFTVELQQTETGTSIALSGVDPTIGPDTDQLPMMGTPIDPGLMAVVRDPESAGTALVEELTAFLASGGETDGPQAG